VAVFVCAGVSAINDYQKDLQFQKLNSVADARKQVTVIRGGQPLNLHQSLVLVGDLIQITEGIVFKSIFLFIVIDSCFFCIFSINFY
jgi:hypothetical protein